MSSKRKARSTFHSQRALDQMLIAAHDNTSLMFVMHSLYRSLIVCMIPLLAIVVGGPVLHVMGII